MLTIGRVAKRFGLSRSTLLYYHRRGLLSPSLRNVNGYRLYSEADLARLQKITLYRDAGLALETIQQMLTEKPAENDWSVVLEQRLIDINGEISHLRLQQQVICRLLADTNAVRNTRVLNKEAWVALLKATGLSDADMRNWHAEFERMAPQAHQDFLESLGIDAEEIQKIRAIQ